MQNAWHIFSDFDGTVAQQDVGAQLFIQYGDASRCMDAVNEWMAGNISSCEMYHRECLTAEITPTELRSLAEEQEIDASFFKFYEQCKSSDVDITILSDGFKIYIQNVLREHGLAHLIVKANDIQFVDGNRIRPLFPYSDNNCEHCANCKGFHIRNFKNKNPRVKTIMIGDGYSDRCGVLEADLIFAKDDLRQYCEKNNLHYYPFENFSDVTKICKSLRILT
ncbi:MAG: 2-hydroxy-3-keto-5-methylthiopentenyl-1-phosphate phosphatase [Calditrichaeota bacterium]|nr:MAG: 2-hydroxy-3-keto-5-methylthiopentenyl-1-phosphate phosphatase [Calditrichota bacterium]